MYAMRGDHQSNKLIIYKEGQPSSLFRPHIEDKLVVLTLPYHPAFVF